MCPKDFPTSQSLPGWVKQSYGYHSDDGGIFAESGEEPKTSWQPFGAGDVVGCGIEDGTLYFTRNKQKLETKLKLPEISFYITIGMEKSSSWTYNFGSTPFINSSITLNQFKQSKLHPINQDHPLLVIPLCIWPLMVSHSLNKNEKRHETWVALLSTCQALREYLMPLFITLSPTDYYLALRGYYIWVKRDFDYYLKIAKNNMTFTIKKASYREQSNPTKTKVDGWSMRRKVINETKQEIEIVTSVFDICDFMPGFKFDRYQPTGLEHKKYSKDQFENHLKKYKSIMMRRCGAAVVTPDAPCCHEAISDIARSIFEKIPKDYEGYNKLLLEMSVVVEDLSQECMATAMTDDEIHQKIIQNMIRISPDLNTTLKETTIL
uniref:SPRY domain-containing protein n=1 Tax=Arcella intermedia TaxID=1963864 RepID=A0A6B2L489_9EUKA